MMKKSQKKNIWMHYGNKNVFVFFAFKLHLSLILERKSKSLIFKIWNGKTPSWGAITTNQNQNTCSKNAVLISQCIPTCALCTALERLSSLLWWSGMTGIAQVCSDRPAGEFLLWLTCSEEPDSDGARSQPKWEHRSSRSALQWSTQSHLFLPLSLLFPVGITCGEILSYWWIKAQCLPVFLGYLGKKGGIKHLR